MFRRLAHWMAAVTLAGCAAGVQQTAVLPWVQGTWRTAGSDLVVRDTTGATLPVHLGADHAAISMATATQILLALDLPFMRLSMAPSILGRNDLEFIQADMLYKHLVVDQPGRRWWLLGGLGVTILNSGVSVSSSPTTAGTFAGKSVTPSDTVNYSLRRDATGAYAAIGAQVEIFGWMHGYAELLLRLTHSEKDYESLTVSAGKDTVNLLASGTGLNVARSLVGAINTDYTVPAVMLAVGVQFNLPSYRTVRRFVSWHAGNPAMDEAPVDPPQALTPPDESTPTSP